MAAIARAEIRIRDVTQDRVLFDEYEHRIPVVLGPGERVLAEGQVGFWALLGAVMKARARWVAGGRR